MQHKSEIFSNSAFLLFDFAAVMILSFVFWFVVGRILTPAESGILFASWGASLIISVFCTFGLTSALSKLISESHSNQKIEDLIRLSFKYTLFLNLIGFAVIMLFYQQFSSLLKFPFFITLLTAFNTFILSFSGLSGSILQGLQKMKKIFLTDLVGYILKVVTVVILVFLGFSSLGALIALALSFLIVFLLRVQTSWVSFKSDAKLMKPLFQYAIPAFFASIAGIIFANIQYIILTVLKNSAATGIFGFAMVVVSPLDLIPIALGSALFPIISNLSSRNAQKTQGYLLNLVIRYSLAIVLPLSVLLAFFSKQFFLIFFPKYIDAAVLFPFLIPGSIFFGIANIFYSTIYAVKQPNLSRNIIVISAILFVALSIPMTQMFSSQGLSFAYLISTFVMLILSFMYIKKFVALKLQYSSFAKFIFATGIFFIFLIISDLIPLSFAIKIFIIIAGSLFYILLLFLLKFFIQEDVDLLRAIARRSPLMQNLINHIADFLEKKL